MKRIQVLFVSALFALLAACNNTPPPEDDIADKLAQEFMQALQAQDYDKLFGMVNDDFFAVRSEEEWRAYFSEVNKILGSMENFRLKNKLNDTRFSGQFYMYEYVTKYENGLGKELITLIHKINSGNAPLKIFSYKIDSSKLAKLNRR